MDRRSPKNENQKTGTAPKTPTRFKLCPSAVSPATLPKNVNNYGICKKKSCDMFHQMPSWRNHTMPHIVLMTPESRAIGALLYSLCAGSPWLSVLKTVIKKNTTGKHIPYRYNKKISSEVRYLKCVLHSYIAR